MSMLAPIIRLHDRVFETVEAAVSDWLPGLLARFVFLAVLYPYFLSSALTKVGPGLTGLFDIQPGAYYQIALPAVAAAQGDISAIPFLPWGLVVFAGTYAEFLLPLLIVAGLFTRLSALGMIGFILVQSLVDITVHQVDAATIGALFDRFPDSVILDQRLLWLFPLAYLAIKGAGAVSLDRLLSRRFA